MLRHRKNVSSMEFIIGFIGLLLALFFIGIGLSLKTEVQSVPVQFPSSDFMGCFAGDVNDHLVNNNTRVVLMVVDAWRLSFLVDSDSPMLFLRKSVQSGQAVAFIANVQTPTVTMPRIKALTSGVVPSLISLVTNFFAAENLEDSWVNSAAAAGRRIAFFGDDTWLRLFPKAFGVAEGVTSFFVNDYTEVDYNVTRHLDFILTNDSWDLLVLHYLGLDHIGHSLGGESMLIKEKLYEMDEIARRICDTVSTRSSLLFVVVGDHGMTTAGSHGGGSEAESRVPMLFFHSRAEVIRAGNLSELPSAEQVDLASTLPFFLRTKIPSNSIGLSLVQHLAKHWKLSDSTMFAAAVQLTTHFSKFTSGSALGRLMNVQEDQRCQAAKDFVAHARSSFAMEWHRDVQRKIIRSQEHIIRWPISIGLVLVLLTFLMFSGLHPVFWFNVFKTRDGSSHKSVDGIDYFAFLVFGLYHLSSYSTSLIEEEHDTWYYILSTMVLLRIFERISRSLKSSNSSQVFSVATFVRRGLNTKSGDRNDFLLLCLHRLAMSFTMSSRRRWSMRPDLLPPGIIPEFRFGISILDSIFMNVNLSGQCKCMPITTTILCTIFLVWRLHSMNTKLGRLAAFPYLLSALMCCRLLVEDQKGWMVYLVLSGSLMTAMVSFPSGVMLYLCYLVRPETLPLLLISFEMGALASRASYSPLLFAFLCQTVFFYPGQSSNISSIDIAIGYKGLSSYNAGFVLFQILANFYATSIALTVGFLYNHNHDTIGEKAVCICLLSATLHLRSLMLFSAITGMISLSGHLFMFSVLAPKLLCEVLHTAVALILTGSIFFQHILFRNYS